ncbi:MAG TPA: hypothetical protein VK524_00870, partial [Polyangiaceae bacterium]|nr:hypothetical protein [Polyangiaceae bacterium]
MSIALQGSPELREFGRASLPWLVRLRWITLCGQVLIIGAAHWRFGVPLFWWALSLSSVALASNVALSVVVRRPIRESCFGVIGSVLVFDTALLTALLAVTGGATNPFTVFYLVQITLSAIVLSSRWTALVAVLSVLGFGLLFLAAPPHHATSGFDHHLQGMWVAFVLAAGLSAFFVRRVLEAIRIQERALASLGEANARSERLAALARLAAGAAHELGTPLCTIAVAASEAGNAAARVPGAAGLVDDLRLIRAEVSRCQDVLRGMAGRALHQRQECVRVNAADLAAKVRKHLGETHERQVELR